MRRKPDRGRRKLDDGGAAGARRRTSRAMPLHADARRRGPGPCGALWYAHAMPWALGWEFAFFFWDWRATFGAARRRADGALALRGTRSGSGDLWPLKWSVTPAPAAPAPYAVPWWQGRTALPAVHEHHVAAAALSSSSRHYLQKLWTAFELCVFIISTHSLGKAVCGTSALDDYQCRWIVIASPAS